MYYLSFPNLFLPRESHSLAHISRYPGAKINIDFFFVTFHRGGRGR